MTGRGGTVMSMEPLAEAVVRIASDTKPLDDSLIRLGVLFRDVADAIDRYRGVQEMECTCGEGCGCSNRGCKGTPLALESA